MGGRVFFFCLMVSAVLAGTPLEAQTADSQAPGSVIGHVYCADTDKPARLARITIEPVDDLRAVSVDAAGNILRRRSVATAVLTQTGADGAYSLDSLPPGQYYIVAELPGYLSPLTEFTSENMLVPNEQDERRFREVLQRVTVMSGQTARMDFRLQRGGAIEGRVLYDDGSPVIGAWINVLRKDAKRGWVSLTDIAVSRFPYAPTTDDRGHYRVAMLQPGEYAVSVEIRQVAMSVSGGTMPGGTVPEDSLRSTQIYFGGSTSREHARPLTLRHSEEFTDADITVAMTKLRLISGTVVAASDGHPIDRATISLVDTVEGNPVREAPVFGAGRFTMLLVPEGKYLLRVSDAMDGQIQTTPVEGGTETSSQFVPQRVYGDAQQPLAVSGDVSGLTVKVPEPANHRQ
jgi:protocatechuate 3,4-dioxygenase beta subunit